MTTQQRVDWACWQIEILKLGSGHHVLLGGQCVTPEIGLDERTAKTIEADLQLGLAHVLSDFEYHLRQAMKKARFRKRRVLRKKGGAR